MKVVIKRAYDKPTSTDGYRVLVDRLWPRGIKKSDLQIDEWLRDVGPSNELRQWFGHDPAEFDEFTERYEQELDGSTAFDRLRSLAESKAELTLVYSAKDRHHNQAVVLKNLLQK